MAKIGVIGAGAWGTAVAAHLCRMGHEVTIWAYESEVAASIAEVRENTIYLPGFTLPEKLMPTTDMAEACKAQIVVIACPSSFFRHIVLDAADYISDDAVVVSLTKGIEDNSLMLLSDVHAQIRPQGAERYVVLSGPSFAKEVVEGYPTDVAAAGVSPDVVRKVQKEFHAPAFRVYSSNDPVGVQIGGAVKNVIAVAAGGCDGLGLGLNARAALITRGLAEIARLGVAMRANPLTFLGLAGMGDLILTCTGDLSRNRTLGWRVAKGESPREVIGSTRAVAEGYYSAGATYRLAKRLNVDMPITGLVHSVLYEGQSIQDAIRGLMAREFKTELEGISRA